MKPLVGRICAGDAGSTAYKDCTSGFGKEEDEGDDFANIEEIWCGQFREGCI